MIFNKIIKKIRELQKKSKNNNQVINDGLLQDKYLNELELSYLYSIFNLFQKVKNLPGHIVELGVGGGRNSILFGSLLKFTSQHSNSKYFGFDTFGNYTEKDFLENPTLNKNKLKWNNNSLEFVKNRIKKKGLDKICNFVEGDIRTTIDSFFNNNHSRFSKDSFHCKLIYVDTSAYTPAKIGIEKFYDKLVPGGIISIDQRKQGGETNALVDFCKEKSINLQTGDFFNDIPAYIIKK
tara:strand:- start:770 stop:1480 length:711 start_codon:yes stop_codon:yes gene_type:complete